MWDSPAVKFSKYFGFDIHNITRMKNKSKQLRIKMTMNRDS